MKMLAAPFRKLSYEIDKLRQELAALQAEMKENENVQKLPPLPWN